MPAAEVFERSVEVRVNAAELDAWHARPGAFQRLQPPWERIEVISQTPGIEDGARVTLRIRVGPITTTWRIRHEQRVRSRQFVDVLEAGPFAEWRHEHVFEPLVDANEGSSVLRDRVTYQLPGGALGRWISGSFVRAKLARVFQYRHAITGADLDLWRRQRDIARMKIAITGATGLLGTALTPLLTTQGHQVLRISRSGAPGTIRWEPQRNQIDVAALQGLDAVIHLAGENLSEKRWSASEMREIKESRVAGTRLLVDTLGRLVHPPRVFVCASGVGYYGNTGEQMVDETAAMGRGFLPEVCDAWEAEARRAEQWGARVVLLRMGVVLSPQGGALAKLLPVFRSGLGGHVGDGRQWMSWIAIDDVLEVIATVLADESLCGPLNVAAPGPVTNAEFASTLARVVGRPAVMHVPAAALRLMVGRMADEALLASVRATPRRLLEAGYLFRFPQLEPALRHVLGR